MESDDVVAPPPVVVLGPGTFLLHSHLGFLMARQKTATWEVNRWPESYPCVVHLSEQYRGKWYIDVRIQTVVQYRRQLAEQLHVLEQHL